MARRVVADAGWRWQRELADGLDACASCAVFVGPADVGAWERQELEVALDRAATGPDFRVFLVLLPGVPEPFDTATPVAVSEHAHVGRPAPRHRGRRRARGGWSTRQGRAAGRRPVADAAERCARIAGLQTFDEEHAEFFFGREADVQRLLEKLKTSRFLAVLGPSGSGKSSLVRAGLMPALRTARARSRGWTIRVLVPGRAAADALAAHSWPATGRGRCSARSTSSHDDPRTLHLAASLRWSTARARSASLWVVDQLEEVFTLCHDEHERAQFLANLLLRGVSAGRPQHRGPHPARRLLRPLAAYPDSRSGRRAPVPRQPDGRRRLRRAIEEPARRVGLDVRTAAWSTRSSRTSSASRARCRCSSTRCWSSGTRRRGRLLTLEGYRESGGVEGALAQRADAIYETFTPGAAGRSRAACCCA